MAKTREIKKRIKAVANIKRITRTMQMIATAKFSAALQRAVAGRPYADAIFGLVAEMASSMGEATHPLLNAGEETAPRLTLVITSDRGLCGPYNGTVLRNAMRYFREDTDNSTGRIEVIGKKGANALRFNGFEPTVHHTHFGDKPSYQNVEKLATEYIELFTSGQVSRVSVAYMKFLSAGRQRPEIIQLLPFDAPEKKEDASTTNLDYEFSPSADELLGELLPAAVKVTLYQCFNDAIVSEHVARMVAMKAATDNAGKMGKALTRKFNRARQAQITTELTEIISGAAALE
jgi:F-type H+-transporting ATPase subunit gamma